MAKSSRRSGRDPSPIARALALPRSFYAPVNLALFSDLRTFHPDPFRPAPAFRRSAARVVVARPKRVRSGVRISAGTIPHQLTFAAPDKVILCVRRKRRKQVMFAKGKAGKRGQRKPRRNYWSSISCNR